MNFVGTASPRVRLSSSSSHQRIAGDVALAGSKPLGSAGAVVLTLAATRRHGFPRIGDAITPHGKDDESVLASRTFTAGNRLNHASRIELLLLAS